MMECAPWWWVRLCSEQATSWRGGEHRLILRLGKEGRSRKATGVLPATKSGLGGREATLPSSTLLSSLSCPSQLKMGPTSYPKETCRSTSGHHRGWKRRKHHQGAARALQALPAPTPASPHGCPPRAPRDSQHSMGRGFSGSPFQAWGCWVCYRSTDNVESEKASGKQPGAG